jgi:hypothetical protein
MPTERPTWTPVFEALNDAGVRYVVVGGLAVVLHGYVRLTADVDLMIDLAEAPAREAISALIGIGLRPTIPVDPAGFADPAVRRSWRERNMVVFNLVDPDAGRAVDLFVEPPIDFEDVWTRSDKSNYQGVPIRIASITDLIDMKRLSGRPEDLLDIAHLSAIQRGRLEEPS